MKENENLQDLSYFLDTHAFLVFFCTAFLYCGQVPSMVEFDPMQVGSVYLEVSYTRNVPLDFCTKVHLRCVSTSAHDPPCALHNVRLLGRQLPEGGGHMFDCALHSPLL